MRYLRIYGNILVVVALAIVAVAAAPVLVAAVVGYLPAGARLAGTHYISLLDMALRVLIAIAAAIAIRLLLGDRGRASALEELGLEESGGQIEVYRGFTRDVGVDPSVARQVIEMNSAMSEGDRGSDFRRANQPNFGAELGYHLGVDAETRAMMREFFATAAQDSRRSFSTTTHVIVEGGRIERSHATTAEVEPTSRYAPRDPENDPNWTGEVTEKELHAKIFGGWDDAPALDERVEQLFIEEPVDEVAETTEASEAPAHAIGPETTHPMAVSRVGRDRFDAITESRVPGLDEAREEQDQHAAADTGAAGEASSAEADTGDDSSPVGIWDDYELDLRGDLDAEASGTAVLEEDRGNDLAEGESAFAAPAIENEPVVEAEEDDYTVEAADAPEELVLEDDAVLAEVQGDPVIAGLISAMELTRRLAASNNLRYLYAFYGSVLRDSQADHPDDTVTEHVA